MIFKLLEWFTTRRVNAWFSGDFGNVYAVDRWQNMSMVLIAFKHSKPGSLVFFSSKQYIVYKRAMGAMTLRQKKGRVRR